MFFPKIEIGDKYCSQTPISVVANVFLLQVNNSITFKDI